MIIFLIGIRGSGKSTALDAISTNKAIKVLQPSTTRPPRSPIDVEYDFRAAFDVAMAWSIRIGNHEYGMRQSQIDAVGAECGITVFDPGNIQALLSFKAKSSIEVVIVGLVTLHTVQEQALRVGANPTRLQTQDEIDAQTLVVEQHSDIVFRGNENENISALTSLVRLFGSRGSVVDRQSISAFLGAGTLLRDTVPNSVKTASYDLRLASSLKFGKDLIELSDKVPVFNVPPYSFVIVEAQESADFPTFISARFDLRVSLFMKGMILSNGPQVDPGFQGSLFCMIYNASDENIAIKRGDHFATIEFHLAALSTAARQLTAYHAFRGIEALSADILGRSGSKLLERIEAVSTDARRAWGRWSWGLGIFVAVLTVPAGWAVTTLSEVIKTNNDMKIKLVEAEEVLVKLKSEREALLAPRTADKRVNNKEK